jgi:hypothetical protein
LRRRDLIETFPENSIPVEPNNDKVIIDHTGQELLNDPTSGHEENEEVIPKIPMKQLRTVFHPGDPFEIELIQGIQFIKTIIYNL